MGASAHAPAVWGARRMSGGGNQSLSTMSKFGRELEVCGYKNPVWSQPNASCEEGGGEGRGDD